MSVATVRWVGGEEFLSEMPSGHAVVFDADRKFIVTEEKLHYRHPVSPYLGETLRGVVKATYLRGNLVFSEGEFPGEPAGREYSADPTHRSRL